jgi:hypothetical protein
MEDYIRAMLVKLQMTDCASGHRIRTPMRKAIDDFTEVSRDERAFFMSACGMIGWLASTGSAAGLTLSTATVAYHSTCLRQAAVRSMQLGTQLSTARQTAPSVCSSPTAVTDSGITTQTLIS